MLVEKRNDYNAID